MFDRVLKPNLPIFVIMQMLDIFQWKLIDRLIISSIKKNYNGKRMLSTKNYFSFEKLIMRHKKYRISDARLSLE